MRLHVCKRAFDGLPAGLSEVIDEMIGELLVTHLRMKLGEGVRVDSVASTEYRRGFTLRTFLCDKRMIMPLLTVAYYSLNREH